MATNDIIQQATDSYNSAVTTVEEVTGVEITKLTKAQKTVQKATTSKRKSELLMFPADLS